MQKRRKGGTSVEKKKWIGEQHRYDVDMKLLHMGKVIRGQRYMLRFHTFQSTTGDMMSSPEAQ